MLSPQCMCYNRLLIEPERASVAQPVTKCTKVVYILRILGLNELQDRLSSDSRLSHQRS